MDDEVINKPKGHEIRSVLDALSVTELEARIVLLEAEIERLRAAIAARGQTRKAAEALFKL